MAVARDALERVRQPEYVGENRCVPCTVTNLVIAAVLTAALAWLSVPLAVAFAVLAVASIWLRGYLVPKTPELTKQYLPNELLAKFDDARLEQDRLGVELAPIDRFRPRLFVELREQPVGQVLLRQFLRLRDEVAPQPDARHGEDCERHRERHR